MPDSLYDQPDFGNQTWIAYDGQKYCSLHDTDPRCVNVQSNYDYHISLAANVIFLVIFSASMAAYLLTWFLRRRAGVFTIALCMGLLCEVLGYVGRLLSRGNPWASAGFIMQLCCLTIGPAFMAAGLYLCLRRLVVAYGANMSRLPPNYYTRIFIPCDVIALVLQATGGALASISSTGDGSGVQTGTNIMIAGLAFQVATIAGFILAGSDFVLRVRSRVASSGPSVLNQDPEMIALRSRSSFKFLPPALVVFSLLILWRSSFRVAELCNGWHGAIIGNQGMFIGFEGVLIAFAVLLLNVFHPGVLAPELFPTKAEKANSASFQLENVHLVNKREYQRGDSPGDYFP